MEHIRYSVACCQTDQPNPIERKGMRANTDRMLSMIDSAVAGAAPFLPVQLVVFPEFAHSAPVFATAAELLERLAIQIPYEVHTSPHDLDGYDEPLFPVADTPIGRIGCAICYDWLFPEAMRQLTAN